MKEDDVVDGMLEEDEQLDDEVEGVHRQVLMALEHDRLVDGILEELEVEVGDKLVLVCTQGQAPPPLLVLA